MLWEAFRSDSTTLSIVGSESAIVFKNPTETARDSANRLSLWLYQITENEFVKNQPLKMGQQKDALLFPPLALNLYYLITPFASSGESDYLLLGKTMQVLYSSATILIRDHTGRSTEELHIVLSRISLEELTRIWEALQEPYRLSVCYQVRVARVDAGYVPKHARIVERGSDFGDVPDIGEV